ncbi:TRAP transporter small permease [Pelagibacterium montanilacus]|uniref:TRAP transporter small permease n=1 Tax=Pelagibacterium montanilacus TaxID=2185280 RepID=UPI000F8C748D|nr:TRAP transporter small permease [Pelagibacterium montanilacus]
MSQDDRSGGLTPKPANPDPGLAPPPSQFGGVLKPLAFLDRGLAWLESIMLSAGVLAMAANAISNIVARFALGRSFPGTEEINQFLIILITFAGIGYAARQGRHIRMSAFYDMLSDKHRKVLMIFIALITAAAMFVLAWYSVIYVLSVYNTGRIASATRIPVYITLIWVPIGFVVTGIQYVLTAIANLTRPDVYLSTSVIDSYEDTETPI